LYSRDNYLNPCFRARGFAHNTEAGKAALETLKVKLKGYDAILGRQKYLAGDVRVHWSFLEATLTRFSLVQKLTLVDLFHLPHVTALVEVSKSR